MITKSDNARINKELKALVANYKESYETALSTSEGKYKASLQPGSVFVARNGFYSDEDRAEFAKTCAGLKEKAHGIIDSAIEEVRAQNTAAPSAEAVNVITLLNSRSNVSEEEIDQLMVKYGTDCPMVYRALHEKAESLGYRNFKPHPIAEAAEYMEALSNAIDRRFNAYEAEEHSIAMTAAGLNANIDNAFPTEEG